MRALRLLLTTVLTVPALLLAVSSPASACDCVDGTSAQHARWADVVVSGMLEEGPAGGFHQDAVTYSFAVDEVFKGAAGPALTVASEGSGAACGLERMVEGARYVVFATHDDLMGEEGDRLWAHLCGGTARATDGLVATVEGQVGDGRPPDPALPDPGAATGLGAMVQEAVTWRTLGVIGLAVAVLGAVAVGWRSRS